MLLRQLSYAIKNQFKAPKARDEIPLLGHFLTFAGSLWHKGGFHVRKGSTTGATKNEKKLRNAPSRVL